MPQDFELDTSDFLGFKYQSHINKMQALSISEPTKYTKLRNEVIAILKEDLLKKVFDDYYRLLTTGKDFGDLADYPPSYPKQKASDFALGATITIEGILDKALDIVLPAQQADFALVQSKRKALADGIDK